MKVNQRCRVYGRLLTRRRLEREGEKEFIQIRDAWKSSEEYIVYFALLIGKCTQQLSARK